jgi:hypothetical protein
VDILKNGEWWGNRQTKKQKQGAREIRRRVNERENFQRVTAKLAISSLMMNSHFV